MIASDIARAPVLIVAYNRPKQFSEAIQALVKNDLCSESCLYVSIDGAKNECDKKKGNKIEKIAKTYSGCFLGFNLIRREKNHGLADNIKESIDSVLKDHKKIIVLEDDIVVSSKFLEFMNDALDYYEDNNRVWHIGSHTPVNETSLSNETFLWRTMSCWGWATWGDRWNYYEKDCEKIIGEFDRSMIKRFNLDGSENYWDQVVKNKNGVINTWAVFWYATIFSRNGLCLNPRYSHSKNIGFDGSGVHCVEDASYQISQEVNESGGFTPAKKEGEDLEVVQKIKRHFKGRHSFLNRVFVRFSHWFYTL